MARRANLERSWQLGEVEAEAERQVLAGLRINVTEFGDLPAGNALDGAHGLRQ